MLTIEPNTELLTETLEFIKANLRRWNQNVFGERTACGTVACFAGWSCVLAGAELINGNSDDPDDLAWVELGDLPQQMQDQICEDREYFDDPEELPNRAVPVYVAAPMLLGLTSRESARLFAYGNNLADLERIVAELCDETAKAGAQ